MPVLDYQGPMDGEDRVAFLQRRFTRRSALKVGAAGTALGIVAMYSSPLMKVAHAQAVGGTPTPTPTPTTTTGTMFAYGGDPVSGQGSDPLCFIDDLGKSNWGWENKIVPSTFTSGLWPLYFGKPQPACDPSKADRDGTVAVSISGGKLNVTYYPDAGFTITSVHINVSKDQTLPSGPGQYTLVVNPATGGTYQVPIASVPSGDPIYVIIHADATST